jgi:hypothetical protein
VYWKLHAITRLTIPSPPLHPLPSPSNDLVKSERLICPTLYIEANHRTFWICSRNANYSSHPFIHHGSTVLCGAWPLLQFCNLFYTDGRTLWTSDQPVARPLPTHRTTQTQNKRKQISLPWVEFEPTISVFERARTVHALNLAATVIGTL